MSLAVILPSAVEMTVTGRNDKEPESESCKTPSRHQRLANTSKLACKAREHPTLTWGRA